MILHSTETALRERVKELVCLYGISQISQQLDIPLEDLLHKIVFFLPPAWQYPEIALARITLNENHFTTACFKETPFVQSANIVINGKKQGTVEVFYSKKMPELVEGPFLKEERSLIDAVAGQLATIIERKQAEKENIDLQDQLRHADRLATIGILAAGVAHELNEPLGNILGFAQLANKYPELPESVKKDIGKIQTESLHAREIIKKLLVYARQTPPHKKNINLNEVVRDGLYFFEARCAKNGVRLIELLSPKLPEITADPSQLNQVLINLVVNALHAMPRGGALTVQTLYENESILLTVQDEGIGMDKETLEKIFIPFFTTKDIGEGTGLGLPVVEGIIASHGGTIKVDSQIGQGTQFKIKLPVNENLEIRKN